MTTAQIKAHLFLYHLEKIGNCIFFATFNGHTVEKWILKNTADDKKNLYMLDHSSTHLTIFKIIAEIQL